MYKNIATYYNMGTCTLYMYTSMKCPVSSSVLVMELDVITDSTWGLVPITTHTYTGKG